ncbi:translation initiation factor eIF-2B subunit gamma isoform X2 [Nematostella vectensis]|uniref:translation initiation factor eIF-2B subunit gamma isoform X2 n=1 Tax=Nematostella vectensis TaxID=45351 RepID=UPI0020770440|nr:translation initiation factor eIF-2B subunit gamma isoform X2 [Nematostella vectensis]
MAEFQAVIMAAGSGSRMYPISEDIPKALLPVGNLPLIWYPINTLEKAGFEEIIVVTLEAEAAEVSHALTMYCNPKLKFELKTIPDDIDMGTADSLRHIKDVIEKDVIVISCDLITDLPLHRLADIHHTYDASVTALLAPVPETSADREAASNPKAKKKKQQIVQKHYIALDSKESRLLFCASEADLEETLIVRKALLKRYPCINIVTRLVDTHLYIMKKWIIDYLVQNKSISTIKGELIPFLVKKQFQKQKKDKVGLPLNDTASISMAGDDRKTDVLSFLAEDEITVATRGLSSWSGTCTTDKGDGNALRCHAYVMESGLCLNANTLQLYMEANRLIPKQLPSLSSKEIPLIHSTAVIKPKSQVGNDSMVDASVSIGDKVSVKRSVIGKHTTIGDKVKISNSVIMDHVTIKDGCNITSSIVCNNAYIKENASLKDCQVGNSHTIGEGECKGEALVADQLMDFD